MINLTPYSAFTVLLITTVFMLLFVFITSRNIVLSKIPMWFLVLFVCIMCLRLIFPFEVLSFSKNINSFDVMPFYDDIVSVKINVFGFDVNIWKTVCIIWVIGAVIAVAKYIIGYCIFTSRFNSIPKTIDSRITNVLNRVKKDFNYNFDVKFISNKYISSPAEYGFFERVILVDAQRYDDEELYYILSHEMAHFHIKTNYIKFVVCIIKAVLWWNPAIYFLYEHIDNMLEVYVDRYITKHCQSSMPYMQCVYSVYKKSENPNYNLNYVQPMAIAANEKILVKRIKLIPTERKYNIILCALLGIMLILYIYFSSRYIIQPAYQPPKEDLVVPTFDESNSYIVKEGEKYSLYYNGQPLLESNSLSDLPPDIPVIEK